MRFRMMLISTVVLVAGSNALADTYDYYTVNSSWFEGNPVLATYSGTGTFSYDTTTLALTLTGFTFSQVTPSAVTEWSGNVGTNDIEALDSGKELVIGTGTSDCTPITSSCVGLVFGTAFAGEVGTLTATSGTEQGSVPLLYEGSTYQVQPSFTSASIISDGSGTSVNNVAAVPEPDAKYLLFTVLALLGLSAGIKRLRRGSQAI